FGTAELGGQYPRCIGGEDQCPGFGPRIGALLTDDRSLDFAGRPHVPVTPGSLLGGAGPAEAGTAEELR
ncbi:MAG: hypothetical protein ACRDTD_26630, partial [Pseudonocardiaceae bacterium]